MGRPLRAHAIRELYLNTAVPQLQDNGQISYTLTSHMPWRVIQREGFECSRVSSCHKLQHIPCLLLFFLAWGMPLHQASQTGDNGPGKSSQGAQEEPDGSSFLWCQKWHFSECKSFIQMLENHYSGKEIGLLCRENDGHGWAFAVYAFVLVKWP